MDGRISDLILALLSVSLSCPEPAADPEAEQPTANGEEEPDSSPDVTPAQEEVSSSFWKS